MHSNELYIKVSIKLGKAYIMLSMGISNFQSSETVVKYWKRKITRSVR